MPALVPTEPLVREGWRAAVDAFKRGAAPAPCPYRPGTKRALFWNHGRDLAGTLIEKLERIGV
jgi:hypothetical protein